MKNTQVGFNKQAFGIWNKIIEKIENSQKKTENLEK